MRGRGITYDTGFVHRGEIRRKRFDAETVRRELAVIRDDLHCNAVQITGGDPDRLEAAARCAAELGLEVWFSPYPLESTTEEILDLFADAAKRAERLRTAGAEVVFVTGVELTLMNPGFLPGDDLDERLGLLMSRLHDRRERLAEASTRLDGFLGRAVAAVRGRFGGKVTYAATPFERIDWRRFDIVSVELIRSAEVAEGYSQAVGELVAQHEQVAITGFACACWRGAADVAPRSMEILEHDPGTGGARLDGDYLRDEPAQAAYLRELLEIYETRGVDSAFVFLFALEDYPHRPDGDPRDDLDLASPGIVKVLPDARGRTYPDMAWEPKAAFTAVAEHYRAAAATDG